MMVRILTAVVAILIFVPILIFSDTLVFPLAVTVLSVIAVFEMLRCCKLHRRWWLSVPLLLAATYPLYAYLERDRVAYAACGVGLILLLALYLMAALVISRGRVAPSDVGTPFFTCLYVIAAFSSMVILRYGSEDGAYVYLICFIGAWVTDTFAYFTGRFLGKHPLIPEISPKKTVEGSIGGVVFCVISMLIYGYIVQSVTQGSVQANYILLAVGGVFISVVSQIGDLCMSAIKRPYGVKDYGRLFPGHGGVLDRFDSVLAVALVLILLTSVGDLFVLL